MKRIGIIGGGVNGLCSAVQLAEYYSNNNNVQIILYSDELSPNTTGDGSAGLWGPYLLGSTPDDNILKWSSKTHEFFYNLWHNGLASEAGITLQPMIRITTNKNGYPDEKWMKTVYGCNRLTDAQLKKLSKEHQKEYTGGVHFVSFTCEPTKLLPYLMKRFLKLGGTYEQLHVDNINNFIEQCNLNLIVNCSGLNAKFIMNDNKMHAIRGQVIRVEAPWLFETFLDDSDDGNYIIANCESTVLGGTHQVDDYNRNVSLSDKEFILNGCYKILPTIQHSKIKKIWIGLRPGRNAVRLEVEKYHYNNKTINIIHNYGHGGSGVTLCWGCGTDVLELAKKHFDNDKNDSYWKSKL